MKNLCPQTLAPKGLPDSLIFIESHSGTFLCIFMLHTSMSPNEHIWCKFVPWRNPRTGQTHFSLHGLEAQLPPRLCAAWPLLHQLPWCSALGYQWEACKPCSLAGSLIAAKTHCVQSFMCTNQKTLAKHMTRVQALHFECRDTKLKQPVNNFMSRAGDDGCFLHWMMKCCRATPLQRTMSLSASGRFWKPTLQIATLLI